MFGEHKVSSKKITKNGYVSCYVKTHPHAAKDNYVFEHRLVVEKELGRYLNKNECVHHINGIKTDNRPENLQVMKHSEHAILTHTGLTRSLSTRKKLSQKAKERFSDKRNHPEYKDIPQSEMIEFYRRFGAKETALKYGVTRRVIYNRLHEWGVTLNNAQ